MNSDSDFMLEAITEGLKARVTAPPNPWVGCIIVKDHTIIGKGHSMPAGCDHAEVVALREAGSKAAGATAYVTLEPCSHHGKTPPCCEALVNAGISRVVIGVQDPDPRVSGRGIEFLKRQGVDVKENVCREEVTESLLPYLHHRSTGKPYVVAKAAVSVDGRIAAFDHSSKWITSEDALADSHRLRAQSQAILIGIGTALIDHPLLTVRLGNSLPSSPLLRVVIDPEGMLPSESPLLDTQEAPTLIVTSPICSRTTLEEWASKGVRSLILELDNGRIPLSKVMEYLGTQGVIQLLVEGGSKIHGDLLNHRLIDLLVLYIGPRIIGDKGVPLFANSSIETLDKAPVMRLISCKQLNQSVRLDYSLKHINPEKPSYAHGN